MKKLKIHSKRALSLMLVMIILGGMIPQDILSDISEVFAGLADSLQPLSAEASEVEAPDCTFIDELYNGENAINPLPKLKEYYETTTDYTAPLRISLTDFYEECTSEGEFNHLTANDYADYSIMISDSDELYQYSQLVNNGTDSEKEFFLSADIVLGNNIDYSSMGPKKRFLPIGNEKAPFTGTFDGQNFEIRNLYFDESYSYVTIAFFGVIAEGAEVKNFGLYHPTIISTQNSAVSVAAVASRNNGTIENVYAIVQEYKDPNASDALSNVITASNANNAAGLVAENQPMGVLKNSYFAGMLNCYAPDKQSPVCATNNGTVENCYYDKDVFQHGTSVTGTATNSSGATLQTVETPDTPTSVVKASSGENFDADGSIIGLSNLDLKKVTYSENSMTGTSFKPIRLASNTSTNEYEWSYPRLYGFYGDGTPENPYLISTPADLIYFPFSFEYCMSMVSFKLDNCIDMNEIAPYAYKPNLDLYFMTNYLSNGQYVTKEYNYYNVAFYGSLDGASSGEEECCSSHVSDMGNAYAGEALQDCHMILNLTINTPATSAVVPDARYAALIAKTYGSKNGYGILGNNVTFNPTVENIHFVGGEISSGDTDGMPSTYSYNSFNVKTATVVAVTATSSYYYNSGSTVAVGKDTSTGSSSGLEMTNVHSSATVKIGTGKQYSVAIGGLTAAGNLHFITDCTNSGDVIGGYVEIPEESYVDRVLIRMGGLLGNCNISKLNTQYGWFGKITHCANYGNVYGAVIVTDDSERNLSILDDTSSVIVSGISTNTLGFTGNNTTEETLVPGGAETIYVTDSNRMEEVANFGMLFDCPIELDEDGDPIDVNGDKLQKQTDYETDQPKPKAVALEEGMYVVSNQSLRYKTHIYGIAHDIISNAYNGGDIYSVLINKVSISGIGKMDSTGSGSGKLYNYMNYNAGNIYMYAGALEAHGIADSYVYKSYNEGNIFLYDGKVISGTPAYLENNPSINNFTTGGCFSGISGYYAGGCYNKGNIYLAPTARKPYTGDSTQKSISVSGIAHKDAIELTENDTVIKNINVGTMTVDLDKNKFDTSLHTTASAEVYLPVILMMGTGGGVGNRNYGKLDFIPTEKTGDKRVRLLMAGCGDIYAVGSTIDCINYADIEVNIDKPESMYNVSIRGNGKPSTYGGFSRCINYGDITFTGDTYKLQIYSLGGQSTTAKNNINFGNITVGSGTTVTGATTIGAYTTESTAKKNIDSLMNGWYKGCTVPEVFNTAEYQKIFDNLDQSKRYGTITIQGDNTKLASATIQTMIMPGGHTSTSGSGGTNDYIKNIINNGKIDVKGIEVTGTMYLYGLSNGYLKNSENHAPIALENNLFNNEVRVAGGSAGNKIINYADITVKNCVSRISYSGAPFCVYGVADNGNGSISSKYLENRGNITVDNAYTATVNNIEYKSPAVEGKSNDSDFYVTGIGVSAGGINNSVNFGDINVKNVISHNVGGITSSAPVRKSVNYGNITVEESGGYGYIGGINAKTVANRSFVNCENFGNITVKNPTVYNKQNYNIGGVCGYCSDDSAGFYSCANYGSINYSNDNATATNSQRLVIGGVVGCNTSGKAPLSFLMNYGDITVESEPNRSMYVGGILGMQSTNHRAVDSHAYSMINYGNVTVPYSTSSTSLVRTGGLLGYVKGSSSTYSGFIYGINYGTVQTVIEEDATAYPDNTIVGSLVGLAAEGKFYVNHFVDLSEPPQGVDSYPLFGNSTLTGDYDANNVPPGTVEITNYTINSQSITDTNTSKYGEVKLVTLDKADDTGTQIGLFNYDFVFRSNLYHSEKPYNQANGLVYQDFEQLSPYLQSYMTERFGNEETGEKIPGAYVMLNMGTSTYRGVDTYFPGRITADWETYQGEDAYNYFGYDANANYNNASLIDDNNIDDLYAEHTSPSERTMKTDLEYYAQQVKKSSLAEVFTVDMESSEQYYNSYIDTDDDLVEYADIVDMTSLSDNVIRTDLKFYVAIDYFETTKQNGYLHLGVNIETASEYSYMKLYTGDEMLATENEYYPYDIVTPQVWLNENNLKTELADTSKWSGNYIETEDVDCLDWQIDIPYTKETAAEDMSKMYTKVMGVVRSEDGEHYNIVVVHVILESLQPSAEVTKVTLNTPTQDSFASTLDNGYLKATENQPSLTNFEDEEETVPINDVTHYTLLKESTVEGAVEHTGDNVQKYNYSNTAGTPTITVKTYNMPVLEDVQASVHATITRQDQIPVGDQSYNDLSWNPDKNGTYCNSLEIVSTTLGTDPETKKPYGTVTFNLNGTASTKGLIYYAGLYKVDLYYEVIPGEEASKKHFATVFIAKEHSPENTASAAVLNWHNTTPTGAYSNQQSYDKNNPPTNNIATGYCSKGMEKTYNYTPKTSSVAFPYTSRYNNDYNSGRFYSRKAYLSDSDNTEVTLGSDNLNGAVTKTLERRLSSIYVYQDEQTGAFFPLIYSTNFDLMAENGDIRRYTYELVRYGYYGRNNELIWKENYAYLPDIHVTSATKNTIPINADSSGNIVGTVSGAEENTVTFQCQWGTTNTKVNMSKAATSTTDGYSADRVKVWFEPHDGSEGRYLTQDEITEYFSSFTVSTNNLWTFTFAPEAPLGEYQIMPYMNYTTDFNDYGEYVDGKIPLYTTKINDGETEDLIADEDVPKLENGSNRRSGTNDNNIVWTIPFTPFTIKNEPNDDSYITAFDVNNDLYNPVAEEVIDTTNADLTKDADDRYVYIDPATDSNGEHKVTYYNYENVKTSDNSDGSDARVDRFDIYSYVKKNESSSEISIKAPYRATLYKWTGTGTPFDENVDESKWATADTELVSEVNHYKKYSFDVSFNKDADGVITPSVTYYKVVAEDGTTSTVYAVNVIPSLRNKHTTLEVAKASEIPYNPDEDGVDEDKAKLIAEIQESEKIYEEIVSKYGNVYATIKELNGDKVDAYQAKMLEGQDPISDTSNITEPLVYDLKSFLYDISVELPAGYTYDVYLFSEQMDDGYKLSDSTNGFDGKRLFLGSSTEQNLNIRIVFKRDTASTIWGVQYIWNYANAAVDSNGNVTTQGGGLFNNYVYNTTE